MMVLGKCITTMVAYFKHNPDAGLPKVPGLDKGPWADAYSEVSMCITMFYVWLLGTLVLPNDLGQRLHLHVLIGPMMNVLINHPWLTSRSAEIFEHGFYLEAGGTNMPYAIMEA